jgi:ribosome-associated protein
VPGLGSRLAVGGFRLNSRGRSRTIGDEPCCRWRDQAIANTSRQLAVACAKLCDDKKAAEIVILDVRKITFIADYFVIASTQNERQAKAIADTMYMTMKGKGHRAISNRNGSSEGRWVLQDFGDVVLHLFDAEARRFYDLESLWADATPVAWKRKPRARKSADETADSKS